MKLSFSDIIVFLLLMFSACSTEETKVAEEAAKTNPSENPSKDVILSKGVAEDTTSFTAYTDSVENILSNLKVSEAQAVELSESMTEMIQEAKSLQKANSDVASTRKPNNVSEETPKDLSSYLYMKVDSFPQNLLPKNTKNLYVGGTSEKESQYLYGLSNEGNLKKLAKLPNDFLFNPNKKTESYYSKGKIFICSEESYKATVNCGIFAFDLDKNMLTLEDQTATDFSAESIAKAQKAVEKGKIVEAIGFYEQVMYPHSYMQVETETIHLLKKAYSVLEKLEKQQDYDSATLILESIFNFWGTEFLLNVETPKQLQELFKNNDFELTKEEYISILEKYGRLLLQSEKYVDAVEINKKLTKIKPTSALAYLQLGNAYYNLERLEDSQNAYKKYKEIVAQTGQKADKTTLNMIEKRLKEK